MILDIATRATNAHLMGALRILADVKLQNQATQLILTVSKELPSQAVIEFTVNSTITFTC